MGRNKCPNCGKRVPDRECTCPRCGHSIPFDGELPAAAGLLDDETDAPWEETDDEIDDPELLAQVEEYVKSLPDPRRLPVAARPETPAAEIGECSFCGRQARKGWDECPWCGSPLGPEAWAVTEPAMDADPPVDANEDGIFDLALLEQAEEYVRLLPDGLFRGGERPRIRVTPRSAAAAGEALSPNGGDQADGAADEEDEDLEAGAGECPSCGRQAQKGWTRCPWCGIDLGLGVSQ